MYQQTVQMFNGKFSDTDFYPGRAAVTHKYFSYTAYVANALGEAVANHARENGLQIATDSPDVVARTLLDFFGGKIGESDGLELVLAPDNGTCDHPDIKPGARYAVGHVFIINAINMMVGVPTAPRYHDGKITGFFFVPEFYFNDVAGLERWLAVRAARRAA